MFELFFHPTIIYRSYLNLAAVEGLVALAFWLGAPQTRMSDGRLAASALFAGAVILCVGLAVRAWTRPVWMAEFNESLELWLSRRSHLLAATLGLMLSSLLLLALPWVLPAVAQAIPVRVAGGYQALAAERLAAARAGLANTLPLLVWLILLVGQALAVLGINFAPMYRVRGFWQGQTVVRAGLVLLTLAAAAYHMLVVVFHLEPLAGFVPLGWGSLSRPDMFAWIFGLFMLALVWILRTAHRPGRNLLLLVVMGAALRLAFGWMAFGSLEALDAQVNAGRGGALLMAAVGSLGLVPLFFVSRALLGTNSANLPGMLWVTAPAALLGGWTLDEVLLPALFAVGLFFTERSLTRRSWGWAAVSGSFSVLASAVCGAGMLALVPLSLLWLALDGRRSLPWARLAGVTAGALAAWVGLLLTTGFQALAFTASFELGNLLAWGLACGLGLAVLTAASGVRAWVRWVSGRAQKVDGLGASLLGVGLLLGALSGFGTALFPAVCLSASRETGGLLGRRGPGFGLLCALQLLTSFLFLYF